MLVAKMIRTVNNISKMSPTHSVSNIDVTEYHDVVNLRSLFFEKDCWAQGTINLKLHPNQKAFLPRLNFEPKIVHMRL